MLMVRQFEITSPLWAAFVASHPLANSFHHPAWSSMIAECYGYRPFVVAVTDDAGSIIAGLPLMEVNSPLTGRRWISLPFTDHCAPLFYGDAEPRLLSSQLIMLQQERSIPRVELRSLLPDGVAAHIDESHVLHILRLSSDPQTTYRGFKSTVKRNIAKAEREMVEVRKAQSRSDLEVFYELHLRTRQRLGVPIQPKHYFNLLWKQIIERDLGFILLAYKNTTPVAGAVFLVYKNNIMYKYGASDDRFLDLRPNNLLFWNAIHWACERGCTSFDWGKTEVANIGLRSFKSGWGSQEIILTYSTLSAVSPRASSSRLNRIMGVTIRNTPPWVCRATGEILYKHFA